jgi:hypothetical protein
MPRTARDVARHAFPFSPGYGQSRWRRLVRDGLADQAMRAGDIARIGAFHSAFWAGEGATPYYAQTRERFEREFLPHADRLLQALTDELLHLPDVDTLCELGTGAGQALNYLGQHLPRLHRLIGVDLNADAIRQCRASWSDPRFEFHAGEAVDWVETHGRPHWIILTNGGVLEYLTSTRVSRLLNHIARTCHPAVVSVTEPVAPGHDLTQNSASRLFGSEHTFSHNYRRLLVSAGFAIHCEEERLLGDVRMVWLCAATGGEATRQAHEPSATN